MRNIYKIEDASYKIDLIKWIRSDFKVNKNLQDEVLKYYIFLIVNE